MALKTRFFVFGKGLAQDTDDRLKDADAPRAIENLVKRKNGRLGVRYDYDALAMTERSGSPLTLFDLHTYNDRLIGLGTADTRTNKVPRDVVEYVNQPTHGWVQGDTQNVMALSFASNVRDIYHSPSLAGGFVGPDDCGDTAAGSGRAVILRKDPQVLDTFNAYIVDAISGNRIAIAIANGTLDTITLVFATTFMRVVCTGTKFFVGAVRAATFEIKLWVYDPATSNGFVALPDPAAAGGAVTCFDMCLSHEGNTFVMAYNRAGPTTRIHEFDANGTELQDFAGAAVAFNRISVFAEAINGAQKRVHVLGVVTATSAVNLYTYILPTTALENNTNAITGVNSTGQASMAVVGEGNAGSSFRIQMAWSTTTGVSIATFVDNTHALGVTLTMTNCQLNSKLRNVAGNVFGALVIPQATAQFIDLINVIALIGTTQNRDIAAVTAADSLVTIQARTSDLPTIGFDVSSSTSYWLRHLQVSATFTTQVLSRLSLCGTQRRQSAQVGDILYFAGGLVQAYDGSSLTESAFVSRPRIVSVAQAAGGNIGLLSIHQLVVVYEVFDRNGNRIQGDVSDVTEVTMTGANQTLNVTVQNPLQLRGGAQSDSRSVAVLYATLDASQGNITFHRVSQTLLLGFRGGANVVIPYTLSDTLLSANPILYSQGARGALSGPLVFQLPPPAISVAASADRVLLGGVPDLAATQESRPHFESEQVNWSDSFGFSRDARGTVLAVARLDERRIIFTSTELFEMDGPGIDDNGNGDLGAPRRLPSDVGLYGGELGWRSIVECSLGILFRGLVDQIYLLPRGGVTPLAMGAQVQDILLAYPTTTAAVYLPDDQTVRFTCNNAGNTDSIALLLDVRFGEWFVEGPFGAPIAAAARFGGSVCHLRSNTVFKQRTSHPPASFIANAWRSGTIHPFGPGNWGQVDSVTFYGEYRGECFIACTMTFDDLTTEVLQAVRVFGLTAGQPFSQKYTPNQMACESCRVDFDVTFQDTATIVQEVNFVTTASASTEVPMPSLRRRGDRVIMGLVTKNALANSSIVTPTGWSFLVSLIQPAPDGQVVKVIDRTMQGDEPSTLIVDAGVNNYGAVFEVKQWVIRGQDTAVATGVSSTSQGLTTGTTLDIPILAPAWGSAATLWIVFLAVVSEGPASPCVTVFPAGFGSTGEMRTVSTDPSQEGCLAWGSQTLTAASLDPTSFTYAPDTLRGKSVGCLLAIKPAVVSEGLVYHYWTMDHESAGVSALKSPANMI